MNDEPDLFLPPADECTNCGEPEAKHIGWANGGPRHGFFAPQPRPRPDRIAESSIQTEWHCAHCGTYCEVSGFADSEWMECHECGKYSYIMCAP